MFERYTEKARRVIFLRATRQVSTAVSTSRPRKRFLGPTNLAAAVRTEIESQIVRHERISTSVEMPLTNECKMALNLAAGRVRETRKWLNAEELLSFFAKNAMLIDAAGKGWNHEDICKGFETLFVPYAKKNASYVVEATLAETNELFVATVEECPSRQRTTCLDAPNECCSLKWGR
jgi:hypothetical protein